MNEKRLSPLQVEEQILNPDSLLGNISNHKEDIFWKIYPSSISKKSQMFAAYGAGPEERDWASAENARIRTSGRIGIFSLNNVIFRNSGYILKGDRLLTDPAAMLPYVAGQLEQGRRSDIIHPGNLERRTIDVPAAIITAEAPQIYGHWLLDYLPRLWLLKKFWNGPDPHILLPNTVPRWALNIMTQYFDFKEDNFILFDQHRTELQIKHVLVPSFLHCAHEFHFSMNEFVHEVVNNCIRNQPKPDTGSRIYISRHLQRNETHSRHRYIRNDNEVMNLAQKNGYSVVCPERLSWHDQIRVFSAANSIVGEDGSAMHNSIFAPSGTVVATLPTANHVQISLSALREHPTTFLPALDIREEPNSSSYIVDLDRVNHIFSST